MDLEPYGWYSPEQIAARAAQRVEMRAARRGIPVPALVTATIRGAALASLHAMMLLDGLDRRILALISPRR